MHQRAQRLGRAWGPGLILLVLLGIGSPPAPAQPVAPSAEEARVVDAIRKASVAWDRRSGPDRTVIDQVCLVPDLPTFLEAIGTWDDQHFFPILIDDVDFSLKFLRAFRPARVVRYPRAGAKLAPEQVWTACLAAVGRSWSSQKDDAPPGDRRPEKLGPTPPGVVLSAPESPMLAGAVALAAGRFQPLVRWDVAKHTRDDLSESDAQALALELEKALADRFPHYDHLGDDCDFLTLAGDWPYRYAAKEGHRAFDDLLGRFATGPARWAFVGRLPGDLASSVYRAMCSLFLQPRSALLFNAYTSSSPPWSRYTMTGAAEMLGTRLPVAHRAGPRADLSAWHESFDPRNRFGLVLINTSGGPDDFNLPEGPGRTADVPPSVPAVVLTVHSFSAANPDDPGTLAGRWLTNGAYVYFGSMNEPFLESFRVPATVATLIAEHLPLSAVMRKAPPEPFGHPWRLVYLGDPLYRVEPDRREPPRLARWGPVQDWPAYEELYLPEAGAPDDLKLRWALKRAIFRTQTGMPSELKIDLADALLAIDRGKLSREFRPLLDALLIDILLTAQRPDDLLAALLRVPEADRSRPVRPTIETLQAARLQKLIAARDPAAVFGFWSEVARSRPSAEHLRILTTRVGNFAEKASRLADWRARLRSSPADPTGHPVVAEELKRVQEKLPRPSPAR